MPENFGSFVLDLMDQSGRNLGKEFYLDDFVMAVPEPFHDLYVFYALAQISAKEADDVSYANFMKDYHSLLSEAMRRNAARQAYPEQQGWSK